MRQLQIKYSKEMLRSTTLATLVLGIGGMVFLGGACNKVATNTNGGVNAVNTNTVLNSNVATNATVNSNQNINSNENTNVAEVDTSDWQTYTNAEYQLTFKYPSTWNIKQEWLENGSKGKKYNIFLQNEKKESILFFLTTNDFIAEEIEGYPMYITGEPSTNTVEDLKKRGLPIYAKYNKQADLETTYYVVPTYVGTNLNLLTLLENQEKQFPFLSIDSPELAYWKNLEVDSSEVDIAIENFETQNLSNQKANNEYLALIRTIQY